MQNKVTTDNILWQLIVTKVLLLLITSTKDVKFYL